MHLLIAAAGSGRRMGAAGNKLLLPVAGRPVLAWTLEAALACPAITWIGIVGQAVDEAAIAAIVASARPDRPVVWILGGETRQESVSRGLAALPPQATGVLIHDGARCLVEPDLLARCADAVAFGAAVIAATPVTDTIKQVDGEGEIQATPDRRALWAAQTPQGFPVADLRAAHAVAEREGWSVTDDAALFERLGRSVRVLEAPPSNIKLTTPFDLIVAEAVLAARCQPAEALSPEG
ncbi:2-C-methyl-D-erythritol 4-phosphate cytidylyltransferase [Cyanobium sp. PCC 7001]|uniref:2-C-methyl-D-erythritol 4-phosphate cytidylyltransferase n=1 Tax=Cyanobium sp. PCC 7001 TaxID=180281 RepID=UPI00018057F6|nr:2-C-methyl-D-erythritol 4-phosphate cytidylyltransferase [Cyanobium sp. PCC 7001]EDY38358.1 2-C-methyl-D-erythritol 4-phosphate cytidylyltransferase [Cyanobium sp. PCC 7001]